MFYYIYTNNYDAAKAKNSCDHEIELLTASFAHLELTCLPTPMEVEVSRGRNGETGGNTEESWEEAGRNWELSRANIGK